MYQVLDPPRGGGGWTNGGHGVCNGGTCASMECSFYGCRLNRHQQQMVPDHLYRQLTQPYTPLPMVPEIDYERLADMIAERLQRPKGYQG